MDKLKIMITKLTMLADRQLNYLLNDKLNQKLPPFINLGKLGLNFGIQGMQFMATSTTAENQTLSYPMYDEVRAIVPAIVEDQPRYKEIQKVRNYLLSLQMPPTFGI